MASLIIWMLGIGLGISLLILSAAASAPLVHMAVCALIALVIAVLAVRHNRELRAQGASEPAIAASTAQHMSFVWVWGALGLLATYYFILSWKEWPTFFAAFAAAGLACSFLAASLARDAASGREDATLLKIGRYLTVFQLVAMVVTVVGLLVDGKMTRYWTVAGKRIGWQDWAANNIFFFGAVALAAISLNALLSKPKPQPGAAERRS